jgi:hypothetical protein
MGAIREENKLAFFLPEWVYRMDPMREHGSSRSAGALPDPKDYKYRDLCVLCLPREIASAVFHWGGL